LYRAASSQGFCYTLGGLQPKRVRFTHSWAENEMRIFGQLQPIADRMAQNLESICKNFNLVPGVSGFSWDLKLVPWYYLVLIVNPMDIILVSWQSFRKISGFCATLFAIGCTWVCDIWITRWVRDIMATNRSYLCVHTLNSCTHVNVQAHTPTHPHTHTHAHTHTHLYSYTWVYPLTVH